MAWGSNFIDEKSEIDPRKAKSLLEKSLALRPNNTLTICNYIWLCIMNSELDDSYEIDDLIVWIDKAIHLEKNVNFYDAKACLYAMKGEFRKAIKLERRGLRVSNDRFNRRKKAEHHLSCFQEGEICRTINEKN